MPDQADLEEGPVRRLLGSLGEFISTVLTIGRTRIELLTVELQLEVRRLAELLAWAVVLVIGTAFGVLMGGIAIIVVFWDTHRIFAAIAVASAYLIVAAIAGFMLITRIRAKPRLLDTTLTELARDSEQLRRGS